MLEEIACFFLALRGRTQKNKTLTRSEGNSAINRSYAAARAIRKGGAGLEHKRAKRY